MARPIRIVLVSCLFVVALGGGSTAWAENYQDGDNDSGKELDGSARSGDAVGGQVAGISSSGEATVDGSNSSRDARIRTGAARATNDSGSFAGLNENGNEAEVATGDHFDGFGIFNDHFGDNSFALDQAARASSGDGVGGQIIGVVTATGGVAEIVAANSSHEVDVLTGDAIAHNQSAAFVGLNLASATEVDAGSDSHGFSSIAVNVQSGDNDLVGSQLAEAASGDGLGGQVLGVVSAGEAKVDATNQSSEIDLETGDATGSNESANFVGLNLNLDELQVSADHPDGVFLGNFQFGDNDGAFVHEADAASGDAVGGQVLGVVTSTGGVVDATLENFSEEIDAATGRAAVSGSDSGFVGLNIATETEIQAL